jgi:hypothetical protein
MTTTGECDVTQLVAKMRSARRKKWVNKDESTCGDVLEE